MILRFLSGNFADIVLADRAGRAGGSPEEGDSNKADGMATSNPSQGLCTRAPSTDDGPMVRFQIFQRPQASTRSTTRGRNR